MRYPWCSANMKQCRPDSPTILLRSLFVPDPSPQPPSLPQHHYIFSAPSPRPCSHSQPSIIVARNNMDLFPPWLSLEVFRIWKIQKSSQQFFQVSQPLFCRANSSLSSILLLPKWKSTTNMCWFCLNSVHFLWEAKPYFLPFFLSPSFMQEVQRGRNFSLKTLNPNHLRLPTTFRV